MVFDSRTKGHLKNLYPDFSARVQSVIEKMFSNYGLTLKISESVRTMKRQSELLAAGKSKAPAGSSWHHYGLAADVFFENTGDIYLTKDPKGEFYWARLGDLCVEHELGWGGKFVRFVDRPHLQKTYGLDTKELLSAYNIGKQKRVWETIDAKRGVNRSWGEGFTCSPMDIDL